MSIDDRKASVSSQQHRKSVAENAVTSVLSANEVPVFDRELTADEEVLAALGYKYAFLHLYFFFSTYLHLYHLAEAFSGHKWWTKMEQWDELADKFRDQARVQTRIQLVDFILRIVRRPGTFAFLRLNTLLWHGICRNARYGLGLDHCHGWHSVHCFRHGYAYFFFHPIKSKIALLTCILQLNFAHRCRHPGDFTTPVPFSLHRAMALSPPG